MNQQKNIEKKSRIRLLQDMKGKAKYLVREIESLITEEVKDEKDN